MRVSSNAGCVRRWVQTLVLLGLYSTGIDAQQRYSASGLVLKVDPSGRTMVVSMREIPGFMEAMVMTLAVPDAQSLAPLTRGTMIDFRVVVNKGVSHAEDVRVHRYDSAEREPASASRLKVFDEAMRGPKHALMVGQAVPDFVLIDQQKRSTRLRQFAGKVVAVNFVYTRCVLPEYCLRSSNTFGALQKQFQNRLGKDLILLTVTLDPVHDQPEILRDYAKAWKADPENWRFLTGAAADVQRVGDLFGVTFVPAEGLFVHSQRTAILDRDGKLAANLEGNEFTTRQLADLLQTTLASAK